MSERQRIRILYIEDDPGTARLVQKRLGKEGYRVEIVPDGEAGIRIYRKGRYDVVFVNQSLTGRDGLEMIRIIRADVDPPPTVMITGTGDKRTAAEAMKLGAVDYIFKDAEGRYIELLPSVVEKALQQRLATDGREEAEQRRRDSERGYRELVEDMPALICRFLPDGTLTFVNKAYCAYFQKGYEELVGKNFFQFIPPQQRERVRRHYSSLTREHPAVTYEHEVIAPDGKIHYQQWTDRALFNSRGEVIEYQSLGIDITDRKEAEQRVRESEERFRQFFENDPEYCYLTSPEGVIIDVNRAALKALGYEREELVGQPISRIYADKCLQKGEGRTEGANSEGQDESVHILTKGGEKRTVLVRRGLIRGEDGEPLYEFIIQKDITEQEHTKDRLQRTEEYLRFVLEGASDGILYINREGKIIISNKRMKEILADPQPEGKLLASYYDEENRRILEQHLKMRWEGKGTIYEISLTNLRGEKKDLLVSGTPYQDRNGVIQGAFGIYHDITHERENARIISEHKEALMESFFGIAEALSKVIEDRDPYTSGHSLGVAGLAEAIARRMALSEDVVTGVYISGVLHDIGKMAVPVEILVKPGRLNEMEFSLIKIHPQAGYDILKGIVFPWPVALAALQHHERLDGSGYPQGLKGDQICLEARILAVADVVDAMTHHRPYRPAFSLADALAEIKRGKRRLYDPVVVDACVEVLSGGWALVISEYGTTSNSPQLRRSFSNSSPLPTTTRLRASGER